MAGNNAAMARAAATAASATRCPGALPCQSLMVAFGNSGSARTAWSVKRSSAPASTGVKVGTPPSSPMPPMGTLRSAWAGGGNSGTFTVGAQPLSARDLEIARALGPELKAAGLLLVGIDVIGDWLTEVNVTSPTCMREIADQTGFNVAGMMIDALEKAVGAGQ